MDEQDAQTLIGYLAWLIVAEGPVGPPESARGGLAAANEDAWHIVRRDWRFKAMGATPLQARMLAAARSEAVRDRWTPSLHPRRPEGIGGGEFMKAQADMAAVTALGGSKGMSSAQAFAAAQAGSAMLDLLDAGAKEHFGGVKGGMRDSFYVPEPHTPAEMISHIATAHGAGPGWASGTLGRGGLSAEEAKAHHEHLHTVPGQGHHHGLGMPRAG